MGKWKVLVQRNVLKKDIPLLYKAGLKHNFQEIVNNLKINPFKRYRNFESLNPHNLHIYSLRINRHHRCVFTIDKKKHTVIIWSAWTHYERRNPIKSH